MAKRTSKKPAARTAASPAKAAAGRRKTATATNPASDGVSAVEGSLKPAARTGARSSGRGGRSMQSYTAGAAKGKSLVIVESPSKAKTINKYLGKDYVVLASIGHVRDLPSKNPKGVKRPVPGVDLEHDFKPTYEISDGKDRVINDLKRAAKDASGSGGDIWFATDLDREGEAIAWHLAQELGIASKDAKRVVFAAITKAEIERAFKNPHPIDEDRVNAQQARRILDRIVGYQVSPLLWKKVSRGLSAGRVQSVAVRLVVEREREIRAFVPEEYWSISGVFTPELAKAAGLNKDFLALLATRDEKKNPPTQKAKNAWLSERGAFRAELIEVAGRKFEFRAGTPEESEGHLPGVRDAATLAGLVDLQAETSEDAAGKGPARFIRGLRGRISPAAAYAVSSIETKRTTSRPPPPYITSSLQQAGSSRLGMGAQRTMRTAQTLYEGVDIPGEGPVGLITYMRTDSTHLSKEALEMARGYIAKQFGDRYLPEKPNFFTSSNKDAQEAHEAIRPTSLDYPPSRVRNALNPDQFRVYSLIWERFVACQMTNAQWDSTSVLLDGGVDAKQPCRFRASGRVLIFDGFLKVAGVPQSADEQNLPKLSERQPVAPISLEPEQNFTSPPARYSEASLIKMLESEGIGRPSTYASIIGVIQDRKYVEQAERRFYSTDLGEVVTDKLIEGFPEIMDVGYTRDMEKQLDKVEEEHLDWIDMLHKFYEPFKKALLLAETSIKHAKAETTPAPDHLKCPTCGSGLVFRFGKSGRFLSCSTYPDCKYASPVDRDGNPRPAAETVDVACPKCGSAMNKRIGKFGPFLGCPRYTDKANPCDGILNLDKKGKVTAPSQKPLLTTLPCPTCESPLNLRGGLKGPWLSCSRFPKCRGRGKWGELKDEEKKPLELALLKHEQAHPIPIIKSLTGKPLTDAKGKPLPDAPVPGAGADAGPETLESVADEMERSE